MAGRRDSTLWTPRSRSGDGFVCANWDASRRGRLGVCLGKSGRCGGEAASLVSRLRFGGAAGCHVVDATIAEGGWIASCVTPRLRAVRPALGMAVYSWRRHEGVPRRPGVRPTSGLEFVCDFFCFTGWPGSGTCAVCLWPLQALVHPEGRITAERQVEGSRKGQWLFNKYTVQSLDRLYDAFESKPIHPELAAIGREAVPPSFQLAPGLWFKKFIPDILTYRFDYTEQYSLELYQLLGIFLLIALVVPIYKIIAWALSRGAHEGRRPSRSDGSV